MVIHVLCQVNSVCVYVVVHACVKVIHVSDSEMHAR